MITETRLFPNLYRDSVSLMKLSARIAAEPGIGAASLVMATEANIALVVEAGILARPLAPSPNDLLAVVQGSEASQIEAAFAMAEMMLSEAAGSGGQKVDAIQPRSLQAALDAAPEANLALISCSGEQAAAEAMKALKLGLNVMIFSDNVALEDEIALKTLAEASGLLVMGPDCGTAIIDGIPLGFANRVRRGPIGIIGASGTGTQEVICQLDRLGAGVSQVIGTGGRDLGEGVGGITMRRGLDMLGGDEDTEVIALISNPPAPGVAEKVLAAAAATGKPVIVNFLGWNGEAEQPANLQFARSLEQTARMALAALGETVPEPPPAPSLADLPSASGGRYLRGLFSGGTFCTEALVHLGAVLDELWSPSPVDPDFTLLDPWQSRGHTLIDLGEDMFTRGRSHPMIDHRLRNERIVSEASDPETAVILFDLVLGHGADPDPAQAMLGAITEANKIAEADGRLITFVASVCGTRADPQNLDRQETILREAGVLLAPSNVRAVHLALVSLAGDAMEDVT